jgi:hypothetical protein
MALETILVKDAAGTDRGVVVDKIGAGEDYVQIQKMAYGADGAVVPLAEKPATESKQTDANAALGAPADAESTSGDGTIVGLLKRARTLLGNIATSLSGTLDVVGEVAVANFPATQTVAGTVSVSGVASETTLAALNAKIPASPATEGGNLATLVARAAPLSTSVPFNGVAAPPVRPVGQDVWVSSFAAVGASVLSPDFVAPIVGSGVTYNQGAGSLNILTGTTVNAEFLTRSTVSWRGALRLRASIVASQRIANQNLAILLADLVGENCAYNIVNATTVDVTLAAHGLTAQNVGQFMNLGGITGGTDRIPGRYAIASIPNADTIRFTVAGWPASGTGNLTLFGWNFVRNLVNGVTPTNLAFTTQRRGWADADTTATINTTASPGTIVQNDLTGREAFLMDTLRASLSNVTTRASRYENLPDDDVPLFVWIWNFNGSTAPASTTTWTLGFVAVEKFANHPVYLQGARANGSANPFPVTLVGSALNANQSVNVAQIGGTGAVNGGVAGTLAVGGNVAEDTAATSNPLIMGGVARTALPASTVVGGDAIRSTFSTSGQLVQKPYAVPELDFVFNGTVTTNTQTAIRAAQGATVRQNITQIIYQNTNATATTLTIQEASNTLIQVSCPANMANPVSLPFPTPLRSGLNAALNYTAGTTGANVLLNVTGFNSN